MFFGRQLKKSLDLIEAHRYDLDIMDVMLTDIDGFTLAKKLTANYPDLTFIFLTARSLKIDVLKGFSLGAVDYLKKPIDEEELVEFRHFYHDFTQRKLNKY